MLPSAKSSLINGGFSPKGAAWTLIACFIGGVLGIQIVSNIMHRFMPSHVVDCEHSHEDEIEAQKNGALLNGHDHGNTHSHGNANEHSTPRPAIRQRDSSLPGHSPLAKGGKNSLKRQTSYFSGRHATQNDGDSAYGRPNSTVSAPPGENGRPSFPSRLSSSVSFIASRKPTCDRDGPCYGFTDPCGDDCFKKLHARGGARVGTQRGSSLRHSFADRRSVTDIGAVPVSESTPLLREIVEESSRSSSRSPAQVSPPMDGIRRQASKGLEESPLDREDGLSQLHKVRSTETSSSRNAEHHHHHVANNAFLAIGLQTSIAIALHKLPEGFITYATNHANPKLGVSVFLALFIHNITEGFAMALPLYLAINSRFKAMLWSFVLGGLSQPAGAAVAAAWFKIAGKTGWQPSEGVYGGMFAVTAGIMASVALQLFSESLDLTHSRALCMVGAFSGMTILGISSALTA